MALIEAEYYTPLEVKTIFNVGLSTVYQYQEALGAIPWGRSVRFPKSRVDEVRVTGVRTVDAPVRSVKRGRPRRKR